MKDVTLNPAMGHYLDMANNYKANPQSNSAAKETYARELMQLFTIGLAELNSDGAPVLASTGSSVPTYSQDTVTNLARMLTGWTYAPVSGAKDAVHNPLNCLTPMEAHDSEHDTRPRRCWELPYRRAILQPRTWTRHSALSSTRRALHPSSLSN